MSTLRITLKSWWPPILTEYPFPWEIAVSTIRDDPNSVIYTATGKRLPMLEGWGHWYESQMWNMYVYAMYCMGTPVAEHLWVSIIVRHDGSKHPGRPAILNMHPLPWRFAIDMHNQVMLQSANGGTIIHAQQHAINAALFRALSEIIRQAERDYA